MSCAQPELQEELPYWRYLHGGSLNPRKQHLAWDGLVLRAHDPWWDTHRPPNGWGCSCYVEAIDEHELQRLGKSGPDRAPEVETYEWTNPRTGEIEDVPRGIDPGWNYGPGESWVQAHSPTPVDELLPPVLPATRIYGDGGPVDPPPARRFDSSLMLPRGLSDEE